MQADEGDGGIEEDQAGELELTSDNLHIYMR